MKQKLYRTYGMLIGQLEPYFVDTRREIEEYIFENFRQELGIDKERKRDLTKSELNALVNFILMFAAREYGIYLRAPNETLTDKLFEDGYTKDQ